MARRQQRNRDSENTPEITDDAKRIADRLEQLTVDDAERVLERAIALQLERETGIQSERAMDREALERIAEELDIDKSVLEQALIEQLYEVDVAEPNWIDRLVGPKTIKDHGVAPLDAADTQKIVDLWMQRHEGMRKMLEVNGETEWRRDTTINAAARRMLRMSDSSGRLRRVPAVATRVKPVGDDRSVIVVEADVSGVRRTGVIGMLVGGILGVLGIVGIGQGVLGIEAADLTLSVVSTIVGLLIGGGFLGAARSWIKRTTTALKTAVRAVTNPASVRDKSFTGLVSELVAEVTGLAGDLRDEIRFRRQPDE